MKRLVAFFAALLLTLTVVSPAFAYEHHLGLQIRMSRVDPLKCGTQIRIAVDVVDYQGEVVPDKNGKLTLRWQFRANDRVGPNLATPYTELFLTDSFGRGQSTEGVGVPWVKLVCKTGVRVLRASIYNNSGGVLVRSTLALDCRKKCVS
jgi:hypothetical protein